MKICVVTPRFAISGVPLAQIRFAEALATYGHEVDLVMGCVNPGFKTPDPAGVKLVLLNRPNARSMFWPLVKYFRTSGVEVIFSAEDHLNAIALLALIFSGSRAKFSGSSRVTPYDTYSDKMFSKRWFLKQVSRAVMRRADVLTCVSKDMVDQYRRIFPNAPHTHVYNIVDNPKSRAKLLEAVDHKWLAPKTTPIVIAAGQLEPWKGFADLVAAFAIVARSSPARLIIMGEGSRRRELETLIADFNLGDRVDLPGNVTNPLKNFAHSDVVVLSSYVEGMPNALVEGMMCGCTPVSTICPTGPRELLQDGKFGYLVPVGDVNAIAAAIVRALEKPVDKALLDEACRPFEQDSVIRRHFALLGLQHSTRSDLGASQ